MQPIVLLNTVGLTARHLSQAPRLLEVAKKGWQRPLGEVVPAVTCTAQATMLTGKLPQEHGIVGNGWLLRDVGEVRFWLQSNRLIQSEPFYLTARTHAHEQNKPFKSAKLFWWYNQGAPVDLSVTPKPHYGSDGNKIFDITGSPEGLCQSLKNRLGPFPFPSFWGPMAGLPSTQWIAKCAAAVLEEHQPDLTLVYLPHLDYDTQRFGPDECDWPRLIKELDDACEPVLDAAKKLGAQIWIVNEYAHVPVNEAIYPNRILRQAGLLQVRNGPFGEMLDTISSRAFAVCDHQIAHVYVQDAADIDAARQCLSGLDGVGDVAVGEDRRRLGLDHSRAGDIVVLSKPNAWFAYPFWLDDRAAPDYARTVNIHAKPGYDPCDLYFDPKLWWPKGRALWRLLQKKCGFRSLFDVVPLDASLVRGSHGLPMETADDKPLLVGHGTPPHDEVVPMTAVRDLVLNALGISQTG